MQLREGLAGLHPLAHPPQLRHARAAGGGGVGGGTGRCAGGQGGGSGDGEGVDGADVASTRGRSRGDAMAGRIVSGAAKQAAVAPLPG